MNDILERFKKEIEVKQNYRLKILEIQKEIKEMFKLSTSRQIYEFLKKENILKITNKKSISYDTFLDICNEFISDKTKLVKKTYKKKLNGENKNE